ncbi:MAG: histidine ammonia-lyase [Candidatus Neomarinimicrobiota bacterium]|tara:strand:+ start:3239 stop:4765 length:1527 start_codon:yes stop_codon:yes gene_type:complete
MKTLLVSTKKYTYQEFVSLLNGPVKVSLTKKAENNIKSSYRDLCSLLKEDQTIYGVNTGFGNLSNISISAADQRQLQINLVKSHASGVGHPIEIGVVRTILFLKLLTYSKGYSGVSLGLVKKIIQFINNDIMPVIPVKGSVGASGDLAPLGHMALSLIGQGKVYFKGKLMTASRALKMSNIKPLDLGPKEGLSLINGTQVSTAFSIKACIDGEILLRTADIAGALSVENSFSSRRVFRKDVHQLKDHPGQQVSARNVFKMLSGSDIVRSHGNCGKVQDPYSFRCIPHVHGACRDSFQLSAIMINNEINSVSDNPLIMDRSTVLSSGHFHAEHVAQALDMLAISFSEIGAISERRTHYFMKGIDPMVPPFITSDPGLESGYMIAHVTASALASENKTLAHPASVDSLPTSGGQEDQVSMAPWAGNKLFEIQRNVASILAIELMVAGAANKIASSNMQAGKGTELVLNILNDLCNYSKGDRSLSPEIEEITKLISSGYLTKDITKTLRLE